jgi:hypothetical protein
MDFYLTKPLATKALLAVAAELNSSRWQHPCLKMLWYNW